MATIGVLNRLKLQIKRLHGICEMKEFLFKQDPTQERRDDYFNAFDKLDDRLSEYYSHSIMFMQINKPELYEVYIDLSKQKVKARMLRRIVKKKDERLSHEMAVNRISFLKQEKKKAIKSKNKQKLNYINSTLSRLEEWAKDLNYEERKGKIRYKAQG